MLGLPVTTSAREITQREKRLQVAHKLGCSVHSSSSGEAYLPLDPRPDEFAMREATQRLLNPESRLIDELFWFWPCADGESADAGLEALSRNRTAEALQLWLKVEAAHSARQTTTHNLAVLYHALALDQEAKLTAGQSLSADTLRACDKIWHRAHKRWRRLIDEEGFWNRLSERVRELDDPRLSTGLGRRIRETLPRAILGINARLAVSASERGDRESAHRHVDLMRRSGFDTDLVDATLRDSLAQVRQRVAMLCRAAEERVASEPGLAETTTRSLLEDSRRPLATIDDLLSEGDSLRQGAHDDVAARALQCQIVFGNNTQDWVTSLELLESLAGVAEGKGLRERIEQNIEIVRNNVRGTVCHFCGRNKGVESASVKVAMFGDVHRDYLRTTWRHGTVAVPRCVDCQQLHAKVDRAAAIGCFGGMLLGVPLFLLIPWFPALVVLIVAGVITAAIAKSHRLGASPYAVRDASDYKKYGPIADLLKQGWQFGQKPADIQQ
ncbi:MAG: hypothetical protein IPM29_10685 [Planctomycetes bacterium]|nr:hypothetical protein [Planctomycetota bacterium]